MFALDKELRRYLDRLAHSAVHNVAGLELFEGEFADHRDLFAVTADLSFASFELAKDIATIWSNTPSEPGFRARQRMLNRLAEYFKAEYHRRIRRHAFYEDLGYGGGAVAEASRFVAEQIGQAPSPRQAYGHPQRHRPYSRDV
jgi:hypothetical protein